MYIAWKPVLTKLHKACKHPDGALEGIYVCKYLDRNDKEQTLAVKTNWAEAHLNPILLVYAQNQAYKSVEPVQIKTDDGHIITRSGFVDVSSEGTKIKIDNTNYHGLQYIPARNVMTGD